MRKHKIITTSTEIAGHVTLKNPSDETRGAVTALLGLPPKVAGPVRVSLVKLEQTIRESGAAADLTSRLSFEGPVPPTPWDAELANEIERHRQALLEESVVEKLLGDVA